MKATLFVLACLVLASGCALVEKKTDPTTGDQVKMLTPEGQQVVDTAVSVGKVVGAPFGIPPEIWEIGAVALLSILGIKGSTAVTKKLKAS